MSHLSADSQILANTQRWNAARIALRTLAITPTIAGMSTDPGACSTSHETLEVRPVLGGILVGGASSRMGSPKQLLCLNGQSLLERTLTLMRCHVEALVLLGCGPLPPDLPAHRSLPDAPGLKGPAAGVVAALRWAPQAAWLIVACDQPLLEHQALLWLLDQRRSDRWAVLPRRSRLGPVEPLLAVYEPQARQLVESLLEDNGGGAGLRAIASHPQVACPTVPLNLARCWAGVNTPAELSALQTHKKEA